jgi:CTP:molybdopterin cytidylyltransferase MocA
VAVVHAADDTGLKVELDRNIGTAVDRIPNARPELGMFSSILCAANWLGWRPSITHCALVLGDQPHLRRETLAELLAFCRDHPGQVCQPSRNGRPRHPVIMPRPILSQVTESSVDNLKDFLLTIKVALLESNDEGLDVDIDRPKDYQLARVLAGLSTAKH